MKQGMKLFILYVGPRRQSCLSPPIQRGEQSLAQAANLALERCGRQFTMEIEIRAKHRFEPLVAEPDIISNDAHEMHGRLNVHLGEDLPAHEVHSALAVGRVEHVSFAHQHHRGRAGVSTNVIPWRSFTAGTCTRMRETCFALPGFCCSVANSARADNSTPLVPLSHRQRR